MDNPIIDPSTLSEEQKERIFYKYFEAEQYTSDEDNENVNKAKGILHILSELFGKENLEEWSYIAERKYYEFNHRPRLSDAGAEGGDKGNIHRLH